MSQFFAKLKEQRLANGKTQREVAEVLGIQVRSYQAYEEGAREPDFDKLIVLSQYFGVSTDVLLGIRDDRD